MIPIDKITLKGKTDRTRDKAFNDNIAVLAASIRTQGLQQPIGVMPLSGKEAGTFRLVFGERRLLAMKSIGQTEIAANVLDPECDIQVIRTIENFQREDLDDNEKAMQIGELIGKAEEQICERDKLKADDLDPPARDSLRDAAVKAVAAKLGWPIKKVRHYSFVAELPPKVRELAAQGRLGLGHLKVLAMVPDPKRCEELAKEHAAGENTDEEPMADLHELARHVEREASRLDKVMWDKSVPFAGAKACDVCPENSANKTGLFEGVDLKDRDWRKIDSEKSPEVCLNLKCFRNKTNACKSAMRGAGDRIAGKLKSLPEKERAAKRKELLGEASARTKFITPTVFGKFVGERVAAKMDTKTKKPSGSSSKGMNSETPAQIAKREAQKKLDDAMDAWRNKLFKDIHAATSKLSQRRLWALHAVLDNIPDRVLESPKPGSLNEACSLITRIVDAEPTIELLDDLIELGGAVPPVKVIGMSWRPPAPAALDRLARTIGVATIADLPKLEHFLVKPEAKPAGKSDKKAAAKSSGKAKKPAKAKKPKAIDVEDLGDGDPEGTWEE